MPKKILRLLILMCLVVHFNNVAVFSDELEAKIVEEKNNYIDNTFNNDINDIDNFRIKNHNKIKIYNNDEIEIRKYKDVKKVSDYNLSNFLKHIKSSGVEYKLLKKDKDYFDGNKFIIIIFNTRITVYDYEDLSSLNKDIFVIKKEGPVIKGTHIAENTAPKYYTKGELLVVYDGDNEKVLQLLNNEFSGHI